MQCYADNENAQPLADACHATLFATISVNLVGLSQRFGGCAGCTQCMMAQTAIQLGIDIIAAQNEFSDELRVSVKQRVSAIIRDALEVQGVELIDTPSQRS